MPVEELRFYPGVRHFTLITDHAPLQWLTRGKNTNFHITRWFLSIYCGTSHLQIWRATQERKCPLTTTHYGYGTVFSVWGPVLCLSENKELKSSTVSDLGLELPWWEKGICFGYQALFLSLVSLSCPSCLVYFVGWSLDRCLFSGYDAKFHFVLFPNINKVLLTITLLRPQEDHSVLGSELNVKNKL